MIGITVWLLALSYSFPWARIPDVAGASLPFQRLLGWTGLALLFALLCLRCRTPVSRTVRTFIVVTFAFLALVLLTSAFAYFTKPLFNGLQFVMELSKYLAVFSTACLVYVALSRDILDVRTVTGLVLISAAASLVLTFAFLGLYAAGIKIYNEALANSFGGSLGVWPTGGLIPRLAGTTAEPQQLSVIFLTAILLALDRTRIRRWWPLAVFGILALVLSQSKFAVVSLAAIVGFVAIAYPERRRLVVLGSSVAAVPAMFFMATLPTFEATLQQGLEAEAFTERYQNILLLGRIILDNFLSGIGVGQYGTYRGALLFGNPGARPEYSPNIDLLTIFAEVGVGGFVLAVFLMGILFWRFARVRQRVPIAGRGTYLAYLIGALVIFLNMFIGYEFLHSFFWINIGVLLHLHECYAGAPEGAS